MTAPEQLPLAATCNRCGGGMPDDADLAAQVTGAHDAIVNRRLAVPSRALQALRDVARALLCRAGLCRGPR